MFDADEVHEFIDWDSAGPGDPMEDLGYLAWTWCIQSVGNVPIAAKPII